MKILLNKNKSKASVNKDSRLHVDLGNEMRKFSGHSEEHLVDLYKVYLDEKDASDKYRLVFTINPVCSNVLFNAITEVVYKEGDPECYALTDMPKVFDEQQFPNIISQEPLTRIQAIRDTEYSNPDIMGLEYLPGVDIFNNHILRQNGLNCVMKRVSNNCITTGICYTTVREEGGTAINFVNKYDTEIADVFNTIRDYQRTMSGKEIVRKFPGLDSTYISPVTGQPHIYSDADILSFEDSFRRGISEKNGWFGFYNATTLDIPITSTTENDIYINKVINSRNSCDFIDLFPDRSRFTFVPKKNKARNNRLEKNWEYCLTYPYACTEFMIDSHGNPVNDGEKDVLNPIVAETDASGSTINGLRFSVVYDYYTDGGTHKVIIQSTSSIHNLSPNNTVNIYYEFADSPGVFNVYNNVTVRGLGDEDGEWRQYFFNIDADDVPDWFSDTGEIKEGIGGRFKKTVFGIECLYYFRVFRRLPNFKDIMMDEERYHFIGKYNTTDHDFNSEINKLAFASNIYGDNMVQILYLDDVDVKGITDNLERPLSDIYLTIVKSNNGHELWYPEDDSTGATYADESMTFARCFGKVTSGIDLPWDYGFSKDYNVHRLHNIRYDDLYSEDYSGDTKDGEIYDPLVQVPAANWKEVDGKMLNLDPLEDDIKIDNECFLGDLVEFSIPQYEETILEPVYHRFNTAQREYVKKAYKDIVIDEIYMDDYEGSETGVTQNNTGSIDGNFKCVEDYYNYGTAENIEDNEKIVVTYPGNLFPEGYYYQPHYRIHLKDISEKISQSSDLQMELTEDGYVRSLDGGTRVSFTTAEDYDLIAKDQIVIQDSLNNVFYDAVVTEVSSVTGETYAEASLTDGIRLNEGVDVTPKHFIVFKKTLGIPKYAIHYPDTSGKYIWRSVVDHSKVSQDSEIYDKPFANGAHYRHLGFNFFLRRQDPYGDYELNVKTETATPEINKLINFMKSGRFDGSIYYNEVMEAGIIDIC